MTVMKSVSSAIIKNIRKIEAICKLDLDLLFKTLTSPYRM